jgi:large subunit ribosomal protein L6
VIECKDSRIGKQLLVVPPTVTVELSPGKIFCKNQQGSLEQKYNDDLIKIEETEEKGTYRVSKKVDTRQAHMTHGLVRSLFGNMVEGLSEGYTKTLTLIGVGYRAIQGNNEVTLNLGYSLPVVMPVPEGISVQVERNTTVHVRGYDKCAVGQFAADIRSKRPPEPYKGKGVRYQDEYVAKKEGKRGKK